MRTFPCLFLCLGLGGCDTNDRNQSSGDTITHDNGLVAEAEFEYTSLDKIDNGFVIHRNPEDSRQADSITLKLIDTYDTANTETRIMDDAIYRFHLDTYQGGSGGAEYTLRIWKPLNGGGVALEHYVQSEYEPDFAESWRLIESANVQFENE